MERRKLDKKPKLIAANGSKIEVTGEAILNFNKGERECAMKFLEADVKKPLAAVSAIVEEGNIVVLTAEGGYIKNKMSGEEIKIERKGGTFVMKLKAEKGKKKKEDKKMEVDAAFEAVFKGQEI